MKICETIFRKSVVVKQYLRQLNSLRDELKTADTKEKLEEIKKRYKELESSRSTKIANHIIDIKEISEAMKALDLDYQDLVATLEEFKVIETNKKGEKYYMSDYDGRKESKVNGKKGKDLRRFVYKMPTLEDIFARMTPEQIKLYEEMKAEGLEPRLQLTPIAKAIIIRDEEGKTIGGLAKHIDDYKGYTKKTVYSDIKDEELIYEPEDYETNKGGKELITIGGKTKSKWIEENKGWIVDIVASVQELEADPEIKTDANNNEYTNAEKAKMYHKKYKKRGYRGMSYESYAVAEMRALRKGKPMESKYFSIFTDSSTPKSSLVSYGDVNDDSVRLNYYFAGNTFADARCRPAVRVP